VVRKPLAPISPARVNEVVTPVRLESSQKAALKPVAALRHEKVRSPAKVIALPARRVKAKSRPKVRKAIMPRTKQIESASAGLEEKAPPPAAEKSRKAGRGKAKSAGALNGQNKQLFIVLKGNYASLVDEHGLMKHLFSNPSANARYFKATEIEAKLQIVEKK
jgi:hypothetical protein